VGVNGPFGISLTPDSAFAYVNNYGDGTAPGTVSVIDTDPKSDEFNQVITTIPVGVRPFGISLTPDGAYAYVCNFGTGAEPGTVSVIHTDPASDDFNQVIATIPVGIGPEGVSVTPNGAVAYVANYIGNSVSVIDTDPASEEFNHVIVTIPIPEGVGPDGVAVTPNGAYVYVNNFGSSTVPGTISVIQTSNNEVIDTLSLGTRPHGAIAVSPFGDFVYVGNYGNDSVSVIGYDEP
jgi:YVTN family beta-propeller protein